MCPLLIIRRMVRALTCNSSAASVVVRAGASVWRLFMDVILLSQLSLVKELQKIHS